MMGAGVLTMLGMLLIAVFGLSPEQRGQKFQREQQRAWRRQQRSQLELNLNRASQPPGFVALTLVAAALIYRGPEGADVTPLLPPPVFLAGGVGLFLLVQLVRFRAGVRRYRAFLNDPRASLIEDLILPRAFLKLAAGIASAGFLLVHADHWRTATGWPLFLADAVFLLGLWCFVTGAARFALLTMGGGSGLARINRHIQQTRVVMRPVRPRPWWRFW